MSKSNLNVNAESVQNIDSSLLSNYSYSYESLNLNYIGYIKYSSISSCFDYYFDDIETSVLCGRANFSSVITDSSVSVSSYLGTYYLYDLRTNDLLKFSFSYSLEGAINTYTYIYDSNLVYGFGLFQISNFFINLVKDIDYIGVLYVRDGVNYYFCSESLYNLRLSYNSIYGSAYESGILDGSSSSQESYNNGYYVGYNQGYGVGYSDGEGVGYNAGKSDGYFAGFSDGETSVSGQLSEYWQNGYDVGKGEGINEGVSQGYLDGYSDGLDDNQPLVYQAGYEEGHSVGKKLGREQGYNNAIEEYYSDQSNFKNLMFSIIDAPFNVLSNAFDFEIFGINMSSFLIAIVSLLLVAFVIRKLM